MVSLDISWWMLALIIISVLGGYLFGYLYVGRKYSKRTASKEIKTRDRVEELNGEILNTNVRVDEWLEKLRKDFELLEKRTNGSIHELRGYLDACNRVAADHSSRINDQEIAISDLTEEVYGCHDLKAVLEHVSRIDDAEGDIHELQEHTKMLSQELKAFKDDANNRIENLQQRVHLNSINVERNSEHCECLFNISRDNLGEFKEQMDTIVQEINEELDDLKRSMGDITEEVYSYRDLTDKMDKQLTVHSVKFKDVAKDIEDLRRHVNEGTDKLMKIEDEQERMGNRFSWMKTAIAKQLIQTNSLRDDIEAVGAVRQELTGKIKKLKKKLRRMEVGQTNGNQ